VRLTTVFNFRDLGGLPAGTGTVRSGRLYRSDSLHRISAPEVELLARRGVRTVLDLRRPGEIARDGRLPEHPEIAYHNVYPRHREWDPSQAVAAADTARYLADRYLEMVEDGRTGLGAALRLASDPGTAPLVVHCFAGKDRTGVLVALILALLGVPEAVIAADYARSAQSTAQLTEALRAQFERWVEPPAHFVACPPEAMLLFLAGLRARPGGLAGWAEQAGVTPAHRDSLRAHLVG